MNNNHFEYLKENKEIFLGYILEKFPVHYKANIFLRDIQYGIQGFLEKRNTKVSFQQLEFISELFITYLEKELILKKLTTNTWLFNYQIPAVAEEVNASDEQVKVSDVEADVK